MKQEYFEIGQIVNTFGIKGFVKVMPFTDDMARFEQLTTVLVVKGGHKTEMTIEEVKYHKNMILLKLKGIEDMNQAETLKGLYLQIHRKDAIPLPEDTYFIADLIGLEVYTEEGKLLGKVDDIYSTKANDVYVVKDELGKQVLLPGIGEVIKDIDLENEKIIVHVLEGLV